MIRMTKTRKSNYSRLNPKGKPKSHFRGIPLGKNTGLGKKPKHKVMV